MNNNIASFSRRWLALLALALTLGGGSPVLAQEGAITPNYRDADIREVIEAVQAITGKTFIVDPRVNAKVTLIASRPMTAEEFYAAFLSILTVNSFQAIDSGGLVKIIPEAQSRTYATPPSAREPDAITTTVIGLENINAAQLVPVMRPLMGTSAHLAAVQNSNSLIISDNSANVQRIRYLIRQIDRPIESEVEVIRLENASATDIVTTLNALGSATRAEAAAGNIGPTLVADSRSNSVLVSGTTAARVKIRTLIAHLDTPTEAGGDVQVRYLRYASAEELATKLQSQVDKPGEGQQPVGQVINIWADERTNALIMTAPQAVMRELTQVIDKLDVRRAQVIVEAIIVEVTLDRDAQLGVTWAVDGSNEDNAIGATDFSSAGGRIVNLAGSVGADDATAIANAISEGITLGVGRISEGGISFAAILNALQGNADTNVISTPTIVTLDNQEAKIEIGQEVPFITGQFTNTGGNDGSVNPFQTVNRERIGTLLEITPQINEGTAILLKIKQEVSSLSSSAAAVDVITNERLIETSVIVEDGDILVLGGLIDDTVRENDQRVPILGSIPVLGNLFRSRTTELTKTNLMVFIKPRILRDGIGTREATNEKYDYLRDLQIGNEGEVSLMDTNRPILPAFEEQLSEPSPLPEDPDAAEDAEQP